MASSIWLDLKPDEAFVFMPREWFGEFPAPSARDLDLWNRVREYHLRTEAFDRLLPHYRGRDGSAMPANAQAHARSNRYASGLRRQLSAGFTSAEWVEANSRYVVSRDCESDLASLPWPYPPES